MGRKPKLDVEFKQPRKRLAEFASLTLETVRPIHCRKRSYFAIYVLTKPDEEPSIFNCCGLVMIPCFVQQWVKLHMLNFIVPPVRKYRIIVIGKPRWLVDRVHMLPPKYWERK